MSSRRGSPSSRGLPRRRKLASKGGPVAMGKRSNGEGSVYKRPDGKFEAVITVWEGGRRHRIKRVARTHAEANRKRRDLLRARDEGVRLATEPQTLEQFLERW